MADPALDLDSNGHDTGIAPDRGSPPATPRWVKALVLIGSGLVVLVAIVLLVGGGDHGPGRHMPPAGAAQASPTGAQPDSRGVGAPVDAVEATRMVEVATLDKMAFEPREISVSAGETVTFMVTNTGQAVHEFVVGDAEMQQEHADRMAHMPGGMAHDQPNGVRLQPGETSQLTWRFDRGGMLEYACHEPGHYEAGMRGQIKIN